VVSPFDRVSRTPVVNEPVFIYFVGNTEKSPGQHLVGGMSRSRNPALNKELGFGEEINHVGVIQLFEENKLIVRGKLVAGNDVGGEPIPIRQGPVFDIQELGSKGFSQDRLGGQSSSLLWVGDSLRDDRERG
jgi:hypothetical protein